MTITNDERKQFAARLRYYANFDFGDINPWFFLIEALYCGERMFDNNKPFVRLSDLIEPEQERTCRNLGGKEGTNFEYYDFGCSACGFCSDICEPNFCPHCGARVID